VRSIQVTETPVRAGKFIARKNWIVVGCDDFRIKVFNYNTGEKVADFEAHPDYIRSIAVHPTKPYILSGSDDLTIKLWNWEKNWALEQTFEGHEHFVMCVTFNPKDPNTFASACLDRTVKVWSLGQSTPNYTLETKQEKGVNYVDYYPSPDKPYLITSSDDLTIKVWDYQTKSCVATLEGHMSNVSYAVFHPTLPVIISGSEDGTVKVWNSATYKVEKTLNLGLERSWCIAVHPAGKKNYIASGFDGGFTVLSLGNDEPALSLDPAGKLVWSGGRTGSANDIFTAAIRGNEEAEEGEPLPLQSKELGSVDIYPQSLAHSPNGRFVAVVGDGEYVIYTALAWRNKDFGKCKDFVWGPDSNSYAIIDPEGKIKLYKNFKLVSNWEAEQKEGRAEKLYPGTLLGVSMYKMTYFFSWETGTLVRRLDINPGSIYWSEGGELLMVTNGNPDPAVDEAKAHALIYDREKYLEVMESHESDKWASSNDIDDVMETVYEVNENITSGKWVGDVFIFTTLSNRLNYFVGGKTYNLAHYTKDIFLLGYIARDNKVYVADRQVHVYAEDIALEVLEFQTLTLRGELEDAIENVLPNINSKRSLLKLSRFLEGQEYFEEALKISPDNEQKFELALKTKKLQMARDLLNDDDTENKWIALGDMSLQLFNFKLAIEAYTNAHDLESLFLLYSSFNNKDALIQVGKDSEALGKFNLAFNSYWAAGSIEDAKNLLVKVNRFSEAAILSSTYGLNEKEINEVVDLWKNQLNLDGKSAIAERIIKPTETQTASDSKVEEQTLIDLDSKPVVEPVVEQEIPEKEEEVKEEKTETVTVDDDDSEKSENVKEIEETDDAKDK